MKIKIVLCLIFVSLVLWCESDPRLYAMATIQRELLFFTQKLKEATSA